MSRGPLRLKSERGRFAPIGLATNPPGIDFRCGTCEYFEESRTSEKGVCQNDDPRLKGQRVDPITECCNRFDHPQMKVRIS